MTSKRLHKHKRKHKHRNHNHHTRVVEVIKLKTKSKKIPQSVRHQVWEIYMGNYYRGQCPVCDCNEISVGYFECGHVVSRAEGGLVTVDNLRPICGECNRSMGTQNLMDFTEEHFPNASVLLARV